MAKSNVELIDGKYLVKRKGDLMIEFTYNKSALRAVAKDRGYTELELRKEMQKAFPRKSNIYLQKFNGTLDFFLQDIVFLGRLLEMSPKEFCECFLAGLFVEDAAGNVRCKKLIQERDFMELPKHEKRWLEAQKLMEQLDNLKGVRKPK